MEKLKPGMISSDEPGVYLEGKYGIRCENELLVRNDELNEYGQFLSFETLTMCPFDLDLIDVDFLIELIEQRNDDLENKDEVEEATPEMMKSFF